MRRIFLVITIALVAAAGPASLAAQQSTGNAHLQAQHINDSNIDIYCDSALDNPEGHSVMDIAHCRSKNG